MRKTAFCICENKDADQLISAFVFATQILQSLYSLNPKFQASSHLLWQYSPVWVGPGRKPRRPVFSQRGSYLKMLNYTRQQRNTTRRTNQLSGRSQVMDQFHLYRCKGISVTARVKNVFKEKNLYY